MIDSLEGYVSALEHRQLVDVSPFIPIPPQRSRLDCGIQIVYGKNAPAFRAIHLLTGLPSSSCLCSDTCESVHGPKSIYRLMGVSLAL
jgi:hypothetical protein